MRFCHQLKSNRRLGTHHPGVLMLTVVLIALAAHVCPAPAHAAAPPAPAAGESRPNIILIMSDDMGFSDIGCYGGEVRTPTLDRLAADGLRFTQFYNTGRCCPTRASLLTGLYPHQAGVGWMMSDNGYDGYRGDLNRRCMTIADVLRSAGYATYMTGKWHVTKKVRPNAPAEKHNWPLQRGFDRFYGTIHGAGSFYDPNSLTRDNELISPHADPQYTADDYYYTDAISDHAARYIDEHKGEKPFFMYVAYTAAHWPMHAKPGDIARYDGRYDAGWDALRAERHKRMVEMGLIDAAWDLAPNERDWESIPDEDREWFRRRMEVYAAMVDSMDQGIGRIVESLRRNGKLDNTLVLYLQDNGGCQEELGSKGPIKPDPSQPVVLKPMRDDELQYDMIPKVTRDGRAVRTGHGVMPGPADTYIAYGIEWANASNTPFRMYKHHVHEGGVATPLIAHWPAGIERNGELDTQPGHLIDIMATCVGLAGAEYPTEFAGEAVQPLEGVSLAPAFEGKDLGREAPIYFEHEGNRAIRQGKWKLVARGANGPWELYDMHADRTEMHDLSAKMPDMAKELAGLWQAWAQRANVLPLTPYYNRRSEAESFNRRQRKFDLDAGAALPREKAPFVEGRTLALTVELKAFARDGVLVAQGGSADGYALYLKAGRLCFATRHGGKLTLVRSREALSPATKRITATLAADGAVTLTADGDTVAKGATPGPMARMPIDGLEVGRDEDGAVGEYQSPFAFTGEIAGVRIDLPRGDED